ncbi:MAG: hypothetical protein LBO78_03795 [Rickettsiales bacterium]|jgi:F-type H+-transporting ATPase subunit b|nr:hypothetical protein [Rickettsiales bacterium]
MGIDWTTVLFQILNFVIVVLILRRYLFHPVLSAMERRDRAISDRLRQAERLAGEAEAERAALQAERAMLEEEREAAVKSARTAAEAESRELLKSFRRAMQSRQRAFDGSLKEEREALRKSVAAIAGRTIFDTVASALSGLAGASVEEAVLESFISRLEQGRVEKLRELRRYYDESGKIAVVSSFRIGAAKRMRIWRALASLLGRRKIERLAFRLDGKILCGLELVCDSLVIGFGMDAYLARFGENLDAAIASAMDLKKPVKRKG